jgi:catechol 2,3-dioxygenase-like lactoylglutathione lyase family enzyme
MKVQRFDHIVLTVRSIDATCDFYTRVLGMEVVTFRDGRTSLHFGEQRINLHQAGHELELRRNILCRVQPISAL